MQEVGAARGERKTAIAPAINAINKERKTAHPGAMDQDAESCHNEDHTFGDLIGASDKVIRILLLPILEVVQVVASQGLDTIVQ